ncbi:MAG TPA: hypothetical protein VF777_14025 [Phycisphaerales bacterium]
MNNRRVILELSPSRLELASVRGRRIEAWSVARFDRSVWPHDLRAAIAECAKPLAAFVTEHSLMGCDAVALCRTSTVAVQTSAVPSAASQTASEDAARLAVSTTVEGTCDPDDAEALCIGSDSGPTGRRHLLSYADSDETLRLIESLLTQCQLHPRGVIPLDAVASVDVLRLLEEASIGATAALWIGEHSSVLAVGIDGDARFVRPIGVGTETLVDALTRPLRRSGEATPSVCLPRTEARRLMAEIGFPGPDDEIPGLDGFNGEAVLPLLQPLVQRIGLEIKQSLRYATSSEHRDSVTIRLRGPGATVRGLADAIARSTGQTAEAPPTVQNPDSSVCGAIESSVRLGLLPALFTKATRQARNQRRFRAAVLAGIGAALCFIGYEWLDATRQIQSLREHAQTAREVQAERQALSDALARALADMQGLQGVRDRVLRTVGSGADPAGFLASLGGAMPGDIHVSGIELQSNPQGSHATVRGKLTLRPGLDAGGAIRKFVASLAEIPIVSQARLGRTARVTEETRELQSFEVNIELTPIPAAARVTLGAAETEGGQQ